MIEQFNFFLNDIGRIIGKKKYRFLIVIFTRSFWGLFIYRFERSGYLIFKRWYSFIRLPLLPFLIVLQSFSNIDIHYKANIKGGILILHPSLGIVISGRAIIGKNITLTGGNVIGYNEKSIGNEFTIGNNCVLGANAVIIGNVVLGNNLFVGASACVTKSFFENDLTLVGVPAKKMLFNEK
ncbi:Serine acetyltransferase [Flavobacterium sp. 9AF]|uniref:serine acetyltransferase n=1 Tax=Flavobacterium sp. 9AF TaxID=2653142 RepID=UPI0012F3F58D|nr:serine acetyltransferase [Flavobacterium sp. 9AF]VXC31805.1 Serine acetyltransferase [Flavobacterium sp. 9AF]